MGGFSPEWQKASELAAAIKSGTISDLDKLKFNLEIAKEGFHLDENNNLIHVGKPDEIEERFDNVTDLGPPPSTFSKVMEYAAMPFQFLWWLITSLVPGVGMYNSYQEGGVWGMIKHLLW